MLGERPDGFGLIVVMTILFVLGIGVVAPVLPAFIDELGLSNTGASLLLSSFAVGRLLFTIPAGPIIDRFHFRPITIASGAVLFLAMAVASLTSSFALLLAAQAVAGAASAQYTTAAMTTLVERAPSETMGRLLGAFQSLLVLVISFAPTIGGVAATTLGIHGPFVVSAAGGLGAMMLAVFLLDREASQEPVAHDPIEHSDHPQPSRRDERRELYQLIRSRAFVLSLVVGLAATWSIGAIRNTLVPLFADAHLNMSEASIGVLLTFGGLTGMVAILPAGHALDAFGRQPVVRWGMVAVGATATAFVLVDSVWAAFLVLGAMGLARGMVSPAPAVIVADIAASRTRGSAMAIGRMGPAIGLAAGPVSAGLLTDGLGLRGAFLVGGLFLSLLALITIAMPETLPSTSGSQSEAARPSVHG